MSRVLVVYASKHGATVEIADVMVRAVHAPEGDFRDWEAIDEFAGEVANRLSR